MKLHWGNGILIFIILFLALSAVFIVFSLRQNNDLVEKDYYDKGADYSHQIEINNRSAIFNDSVWVADSVNYIVLKVSNQLANATSAFNAYFFRPSDQKMDYKVQLPGAVSMRIDKAKLVHGRYLLKLSWESGGEMYMVEKVVFVKK